MGKEKLGRRDQTILNYKKNGGNLKKAMIDAGYSESYADSHSKYLWGIIGHRIEDEQKEIKNGEIKDIEDIQVWWSKNIDDEELDMKDRIKCSENLMKSIGGFVEKVDVEVKSSPKFDDIISQLGGEGLEE